MDNAFVINRHVSYVVEGIAHYAFCLAVSSESDLSSATTVWYAYEYKMDAAIPCVPTSKNCTTGTTYYYFPDWPRIGTRSNWHVSKPASVKPPTGFSKSKVT